MDRNEEISIRKIIQIISISIFIIFMAGCGHPHNVDIQLPDSLPETKVTSFSDAIASLGLMTEIYGDNKIRVMVKDIYDNTGASLPTNAEVPRDITEMIKSTLNGIGGNIIFIPYDPNFMISSAQTGYGGFEAKLLPNVVVSGGITEFDRGLTTKGKETDLGLEGEVGGIDLGWEYSTLDKNSLASITLDFNLIDFQMMAGIAKVQAINTIKVYKAMAEDSLGFTIQGNVLGLKGTVKKVQGRHAAIRLLVELSMIQIMGKYLNLPYWRLLPNGTPDPLIIDNVTADFYSMDNTQKIIKIQECLALNGYSVALNGVLDDNTVTALKDFKAKHPEATGNIDKATFLALYSSIPISRQSISRRKMLVRGEVPVNAAAIDTPAGHSEPTSSSGGVPAKKDSSINVAGSLDNILRLTTNSTSYRIGDEMKIFFEASKPLHIRVVSYSSSGEIATLFPNQYQSDNLIKSRKKYQIPPIEAPFTLHVAGPAGVDKIMAIGSERPFPPNFNPITEQGEFTQEVTQSYPILVKTTININ